MSNNLENSNEKLPSIPEAMFWRILMYAAPIGLGFLALYLYPDIESYKKSKVETLLFGVMIFLPFILIYDWKWLKKHQKEINRFSLKREWFDKIDK